MQEYNRLQLEADLKAIEVILHRIRENTGMTASVFPVPAGDTQQTNTRPQRRKKQLNPATIQFLANYLNRPDIPRFFNQKP